MKMKTCKSVRAVTLAALSLTLTWAGAQNSGAQTNTDLYPAKINLVCISTNQGGDIVYQRFNTSAFVEEFATGEGITNLTDLSLVFNRSNASLQVISGTNQTLIGSPLGFAGGVSLANSNNTRVQLQTFVFLDGNSVASGLLSATERLTWGTSNQLTSFSLRGLLSYSFTNGTNSPAICHGSLLVGSAIVRDDDDDDNCDSGNGNNGNHGNGNNGNHYGNSGPRGNGKR